MPPAEHDLVLSPEIDRRLNFGPGLRREGQFCQISLSVTRVDLSRDLYKNVRDRLVAMQMPNQYAARFLFPSVAAQACGFIENALRHEDRLVACRDNAVRRRLRDRFSKRRVLDGDRPDHLFGSELEPRRVCLLSLLRKRRCQKAEPLAGFELSLLNEMIC